MQHQFKRLLFPNKYTQDRVHYINSPQSDSKQEWNDNNSKLNKQWRIPLFEAALLRSTKGFRKSLNGVAMIHNEHDRNTRNLPNPTLQVFIAGGNDVATILPFTAIHHAYSSNTLNNTVISIGSLVRAGESLEARVFRQTESNMIARAQLLQLSHNAIRDIRNALCKQAIH